MRRTNSQFIEEAKTIHGDKYNYSKTEYINCKTKVCIICPIHGEFWQTPDGHLHGQGCPKCANKNVTTEEFIEKARKVHGDKYDYSKVQYVNNRTKVTIICPEHGEFLQTPDDHLQGKNCYKCAKKKMGVSYNTEIFIEKAKKIFPQYDYSKVNYVNSEIKVTIICPIHGEFQIVPSSLLRGHGCAKCLRKYNSSEDYIKKALEVHGDKYDYSKLKWVDSKTKIEIICKEHGSFLLDPYKHLMGAGCPICAKQNRIIDSSISKGEKQVEEWLIENNIKFYHNSVKISIDEINVFPDFILDDYNIIIEYNGIQHYKYVPYFHQGGTVDFEYQLYRDNKLKKYCLDNNITFLEIRYDLNVYDELEKLKERFENGK